MKTLEQINILLKSYRHILSEKYNVSEIGIFGSVVRNEQVITSDIDILVDFKKTPSLFKFLELETYLIELLGCKVDLVMKTSLKPAIGKNILQEVVYI